MLKWMDVVELMGYLTAVLSVSVSYVSKIQKQHYSDFLKQNNALRQTLLSPFSSKVIIGIILVSLLYFITQLVIGEQRRFRDKYFNSFYVLFLGVTLIVLLWHLYKGSFAGSPMLILGILMIYLVEFRKVHKENG